MRVEGYLFVPYNGQYRFSLEVWDDHGIRKANSIRESSRHWDYMWDATMRGRPTLKELADQEQDHVSHIRVQFRDPVLKLFRENSTRIMNSRHSTMRFNLNNGSWVEFVNVT